jgi:signal transduction histidine kinase
MWIKHSLIGFIMSWKSRAAMQITANFPRHSFSLWAARVAWVSFFAIIVSLLLVNTSGNIFSTVMEYQVQNARSAIFTFTSMFTFARWLVATRWLVVAVYFSVAILIAWRKRDDWFALTVSITLMLLAWGFVMRGDHTTWKYPQFLAGWATILHMILSPTTILSLVLLFFLFPNGRFVTRWLKRLALVVVLASFLFGIADQFRLGEAPSISIFGLSPWDIWISLLLSSMLAALAGQVYRYRRLSTPTQQQQMKWVMVGLGGMLAIPLISWPLGDYGGAWGSLASIWIELAVSAFLPVTIGFSILRYRLWDVDLVINRTLVYGTLTTLILGFYGLSVGLASILLPAQNTIMLSIMALVIVLLFVTPLRPRLQRVADRWLSPSRPEPIEEALPEKPASSVTLRLAQVGWVATLLYLFWLVGSQFTRAPYQILSIEGDYLIVQSLKLAWLPAEPFILYANVILRAGVAIAFWLAAVLIFLRKRQDGFALAISFVFMTTPFGQILNQEDNPILNILGILTLLALALFPFLFPDGRFIPRSSKWRVALIVTIVAVSLCTNWLMRISRPEYSTSEFGYVSMMAALLVMLAAGLGSQIYRYRTFASPLQRLQTKWVLFGFGIQLVWILWLVLWITGLLAWAGLSEPWMAFTMLHLNVLGTIALPATIAISITRYRLWEIDLLINRSLVFGGLTLLVAGTYIILVGVLGLFFQSGENTLLSILATGLIAILFHPLRQRLQQIINRIMYGDRDDPASVLSKLGQRLAQAGLPGDVLPAILEDIAQALKLPYVAIRQYRVDGQSELRIIEQGQPSLDLHAFPLVYRGQEIGQLLVAARSPGESFAPQERRLLENIAQQAGAAVYAAQLTAHLQQSRLRLITSREEERRRIHRDLHDGLGPQLATLSLKLDAASNYLAVDPAASEQLLKELKGQVQDAIQDVRRLVYDLRPAALDQLGLAPALREYAAQQNANGMQVCVEAPDLLPDLPAAVEVAAYRIVLEALTNAVRHAQASQCSVRITAGELLYLEIEDNGVGMPIDAPVGVGLSSMRERAVELGGEFRLLSRPGEGTHLSIRLPLSKS